ncbi:MAG: ATP-binding protein [Nodosilinea sp.]
MPPNFKPGPSLLDLWQAQAPRPACITLLPEKFEAHLRSLVEFLIHHGIQAHLLTKLPVSDRWHGPLRCYHQNLGSSYSWCQFSPLAHPEPDQGPQAPATSAVMFSLKPLTLWQDDYFVMVQAENFVSLLLAHGDLGSAAMAATPQPTATDRLTVAYSMAPSGLGLLLAAMQDQLQHLTQESSPHPGLEVLAAWRHRLEAMAQTAPSLQIMRDCWWGWQMENSAQVNPALWANQQPVQGLSTLADQNQLLLNTLRLKDKFLNAMGQELRTPLTTIKTALTLLDSPQIKPAQRQRYLEMITTECDRQSALINGVLNLLQMETSVREIRSGAVYPADTIPPVVSTYQPLATEKGISLAYTVPDHLPQVACSDLWLRQIMIHLLNNSIKYTGRGGQIWVTARQMGRSVQLEVRDTGVGIIPSDLPHIFNYFYRGRHPEGEAMEGSGLGLAIVQQLLLFCDGHITVSSEVGRGSRFLVQLPIQPVVSPEP